MLIYNRGLSNYYCMVVPSKWIAETFFWKSSNRHQYSIIIATTYILNFLHHLAAILWWSWVNENDSWLSWVKLTHACMWGVWNWWWPKQYCIQLGMTCITHYIGYCHILYSAIFWRGKFWRFWRFPARPSKFNLSIF